MKKITENFSQLNGLEQKDVEFANIYLGIDNPLYVDFNKILSSTDSKHNLATYINEYMSDLTHNLFNKNENLLKENLEGIHESNETYLGMSAYSNNLPQGNSIGYKLKSEIFDDLISWKDLLMKTPFIDSFQYGVKGIGSDRISDIVVSICKEGLIKFTQEQCLKYHIPIETFMIRYYNADTHKWGVKSFDLPSYKKKPLIMIPKNIVSTNNQLSSNFIFFIRLAFQNYFRHNEEWKRKVREADNLQKPLIKKEFDEAIIKEGVSPKDISKEAFSKIENVKMVNMIGDVRQRSVLLTDDELNHIIEESFNKKNNKIA